MLYDGRSRRRRRLGVALLGAAVLTAAVGLWLARPGDPVPATQNAPPLAPTRPVLPVGAPSSGPMPQLPDRVAATDDPEQFAESVAHALFDWDTTLPIPLSDHTGRLLAVADPTGAETPGLIADVSAYLPTTQTWAFLRTYYTRQWIDIESIEVPDLWPQAVAEAGPHGLAPGTTAYTVEGVRHRSGVWEGDPVTSAHPVAFTVFIVCRPTHPSCHLLRLSRLDEPLG